MKKYFNVNIRLVNDDRVNVMMVGENLFSLVEKLKGPQITFVPNKQADFHSFSVYTHMIMQIQYEVVNVSHFDQPIVYDAFSM